MRDGGCRGEGRGKLMGDVGRRADNHMGRGEWCCGNRNGDREDGRGDISACRWIV